MILAFVFLTVIVVCVEITSTGEYVLRPVSILSGIIDFLIVAVLFLAEVVCDMIVGTEEWG